MAAGNGGDRLLPGQHPDLSAVSANRAAVLVQRFLRSGAPSELDAANAAAQRSISLSADDDSRGSGQHSNLGGLLRTRFQMTGTRSDIDAAIEQGRLAVRRLSRQTRQPAALYAALAGSLARRSALTHADADLAETIDTARRALAHAPAAGRERLMALGVLAAALQMDFERTGSPDSTRRKNESWPTSWWSPFAHTGP